jgi:hypothetical protein
VLELGVVMVGIFGPEMTDHKPACPPNPPPPNEAVMGTEVVVEKQLLNVLSVPAFIGLTPP